MRQTDQTVSQCLADSEISICPCVCAHNFLPSHSFRTQLPPAERLPFLPYFYKKRKKEKEHGSKKETCCTYHAVWLGLGLRLETLTVIQWMGVGHGKVAASGGQCLSTSV
ncbi:hypothetical protein AVEN_12256-1 [Araneus ventricosus]|uniref:Uncharacterized protein n=1 Tax=Araneus ventricosus TaxID=182803 RepID=A0A4Y2VQY9_ARAVE|nr:hypothetical protein AVEN_12256-1 [Araneus ventricosus]